MRNEILVIFEESKKHKKEDLTNYIQLNRKECLITTLGEISQGNGINIKDFNFVLDCSNENKLFEKNKDKGHVLKKGKIEFLILDEKNMTVVKGPSLSRLSGFNSNIISIKEKFEEEFELYNECIEFLIHKNGALRNKDSFNKSSAEGLILNDVIKGNSKKIYKLVYELPVVKEPGTEYVLFENIEMLKSLKEIIDGMVFA